MATTLDTLNIKLNAQQAIDIMFEPVFTDPDLMSDFAIVKTLFGGEYKLGLMEQMKNVVGKAQACSPKYKGKASLSERSLWAKYQDAGLQFCYEEFLLTHYDYLAPLYTTANGQADLTQLLNIFTKLLGDGIKRDVSRGAWYGDPTSTDDNLNWCKGMFAYLAELILTGEIGYRVDSNQGTLLTGSQAFDLLQDVYENATAELQNLPNSEKKIHINAKLWNLIRRYLRENAIQSGFIETFNTGTQETVLTFEGVPVKVHYDWDEISQEYFGLDNQNKIVYTHNRNMVLGTDLRQNAAGSQGFFKTYQDPKTDELFVSSKFVFDANYVWPELFSVAL